MKLPLSIFVLYLFGFFVAGCGNSSPTPCVTKIIDMSSDDTMPIELGYDSDGRLVTLGGTSISYRDNKILVNGGQDMLGYGPYYTIEFTMSRGRVVNSKAHCREYISGKMTEVEKINTYSYPENKIIVESGSYDVKTRKLIKNYREIRELSEGGNIVKIITDDSDRGGEVALYKYDSNLACNANINLQAFSFSVNGLDELLVYLLNLNKIPQVNVLPDEVNCTYPNGVTHLYNENCCLDEDRLTRLEVMMNYEILILRMNFEYKESHP